MLQELMQKLHLAKQKICPLHEYHFPSTILISMCFKYVFVLLIMVMMELILTFPSCVNELANLFLSWVSD